MKKIISIVLVTIMVLACMPLSVFAEIAATDVAKIGDTGYSSLDAAIANVKNGETIVLLNDADLSALNTNAINYTIDGQNKAYTVRTTKAVTVGNGNVTFKNLNLTLRSEYNIVVDTNDNGDITIDGCLVQQHDNSCIEHRGKGNVTIKNTTYKNYAGTKGDACAFYIRGDQGNVRDDECVYTIEDSTIINFAGSADQSQSQNNSIFCLNSSNGATYKFNLKGDTVIKNASTTPDIKCGLTLFANLKDNATMIINAEPTVQFVLDSNTVAGVSKYFEVRYGGSVLPKIILNGTPQFIASPAVVAAGVEMPDIVHKDGDVRYTNKWSVDGGVTSFALSMDAQTAYTYTATVTENVTFTPVNEGLTAETGAYGVKKFDGGIEYYPNIEEAKYRTRSGETFIFLNDYDMSQDDSVILGDNFFDGFIHYNRVLSYTVEGAKKADGSKVKLSITFGNYRDRHIIFKNVKIEADGTLNNKIATNGNSAITFEKCDVTLTDNAINIKRPIVFNIIDSTITTANDCMFWIANYDLNKNSIINVNNSHLIYAGASTEDKACIFQFNTDYKTTVNVTNGSILEWNGTGASNAHIAIAQKTANTSVLNLSNDTVLYLNPKNAITNSYFLGTIANMTMKVTGNPIYKVNDIAAESGFSFYKSGSSINDSATGTLLGYSGTYTEGGEDVIVPATVAANKMTKGFSVKPVYLKANDFDMDNGAALRTQNGSGIRFTTRLSSNMVSLAETHNIAFATLIASNTLLGSNIPTIELADAGDTVMRIDSNKSKWTKEGDDTLYRAAIIEIPDTASAYVTELAGRACMFVTYADGTTATFYTTFDANNVRSMYDVALNLTEEGKASNVTKTIIDTVLAASAQA